MAFKDGTMVVEEAPSDQYAKERLGLTAQDEIDMAEVGKRQQLKRNFGFLSMLGFTTTMMCTWEAIFFANLTAMINGGGPTLVYGFIFSFFGSLATATSLAELVSIAPTSGGQYHWVSMLAPPKYSKFLSWFTGWVSTIGWNANTAAGAFFGATVIQGLLVINYPDYPYERWHGTLLLYAALVVVVLVNTIGARLLPKIEGMILILHTLGFFAVLIPLVYLAPHGSASFVFKDFLLESGWNNKGVAWLIGLISTNLPFIGYDGPCHMAEEVANASTVVPWCMVCTILLNGTLGFATILALVFCFGDVDTALSSPTGYDFIEVFQNATNNVAGTSVMTSILIALVICATFGFLASASRQTWAFARDRGLPFSNFLSKVNTRSALPLNSIAFCSIVTAIIGLINVFSFVAFNAIVSLTIAGLFISYLIPICLLMQKRFNRDPTLKPGPFALPRGFGLLVNGFSACYLVISTVFSFFPPELPVTLDNMNWSCLMFWGTVLLGLVFYAVRGRKNYEGPVIERPILTSQ